MDEVEAVWCKREGMVDVVELLEVRQYEVLRVYLVSCWLKGARHRDDYRNIHFLLFI